MTKRETALQAVEAALATIPGITIRRDAARPAKVPPGGMVILDNGTPGDPQITLSPILYSYAHVAEIHAFVQSQRGQTRTLDALLEAIGQALIADPSFGGAVEHSHFSAPDIETEAPEGAGTIQAATVPLILIYTVTNPLGD